jgi:TrpR family transcriptional regulator, trp operon repressor
MKKKTDEDGWHLFLELCAQFKKAEEFEHVFSLFLTHEERENLASRFFIVKALLEEELPQREIADKFKVSIAQITRGSNALKIVDPKFRKFLKSKLTYTEGT